MLLANAADIAVGWLWHTAYRARWHWKLKREWALAAAGCVAFIGLVDTARSASHRETEHAETVVVVSSPELADIATIIAQKISPPRPEAIVAPEPVQQVAAATAPTTPSALIEDQTGSIDQADPITTILPIDPEARKDDPIARKINERAGDSPNTGDVEKIASNDGSAQVRKTKQAVSATAPAKPRIAKVQPKKAAQTTSSR